jgi:shikimate kinase
LAGGGFVITLLIGHRGTGKSTLLRRLEPLFLDRQGYLMRDLDVEIEAFHRRSVDSIFAQLGEAEFRRFETSTFEHLCREHDSATHLILAVGAGFEFAVPQDARVVWVRRPTDEQGRVFLDRPSLGEKKDPLKIWRERFGPRDQRYRELAHEELFLPEGSLHDTILEEHFFAKNIRTLPYCLSALPENFKVPQFFTERLPWKLKFLEVRDDLLTTLQITRLQEIWPKENLLHAVRKTPLTSRPLAGAVDWPFEFGMPPFPVEILSLHEKSKTLAETIARFPKSDAILKLAVPIETFAELLEGHRWWQKDPLKRSFLPSSKTGRWQWYRQLFGPKMPLHFFREGDGTSSDQPYLWQALTALKWNDHFAAVLGSPVHHSWTPSFQREFFDGKVIPVVAIDVQENEWNTALPILQELGLKFAAVTSPHKLNAFKSAGSRVSEEAKKFASVNTLVSTESGWYGHNTDLKGLSGLFYGEFKDDDKITVWGGGGTRELLKDILPNAEFVSAREGMQLTGPTQMVWAVGRSRAFQWPMPAVFIQSVIDLNYSEDSPGREIALLAGCSYKSGETMFIQQGLAQQEFWKRYV